jgi:pyruvate,water dikinase
VDQAERAPLTWLLRGFPTARNVLEVGCGTGHFAAWLASQGWRVVGLDRAPAMLAEAGLQRGENGLEVYVMCEIPANVILAEAFAEIFDGFSIGSNDLTQLTLGLDRDSEIVAHLFDERNPAVTQLIAQVIRQAHACGRKVGICGQAPSDYPDFARFLVSCGIDSISLNPDTVLKTTQEILQAEQALTAAG